MKRIFTAMMVAVGIMHVCRGITVKLDANGGKVSPATVSVWEGGSYDALPTPTNAKGAFDGWWTAKDGGVEVQNGDLFDLSIFANPKMPALYAQYHLPHKIAVAGGFLDDGGTARSGLYRGDKVSAHIDRSKLCDRNENEVNAFAHWTFTPAVADLGDGFDPLSPEIAVSMPNADVKLTANFVNGFAGFLHCQCYTEGTDAQGNEPIGDFYWSVDNGKTLFPFGESGYPVKPGKVTVKFYDKTGKWRAADQTFTFNKRGTYKEDGVTRYSDPETKFSFAKFVSVDNSTKVTMDANGGMGSGDVFFANGCEYGWLGIPYRKGYVFAGWWTAKDGGEHITQDKMFNPADFAGQKTPTIYAHWLQLRKLTMKDDSAYAYWDLEDADFDSELLDEITQSLYVDSGFEGYGELYGKGTLEVLPGARVMISAGESSYDNRGNELVFQKWSVTPSKADMGAYFFASQPSTDLTMPDADVSLQPTYVDANACGRVSGYAYAPSIDLGWDEEAEMEVTLYPPAGAFEWSPDGGKTWYKASSGNYDAPDALLKEGRYTITWRSTDPHWITTDDKKTMTLQGCCGYVGEASVYASFTYVPEITIDVMTIGGSICEPSCAPGGTATMNPKDGLVPPKKTITLTAKAAKDYAFQGWALAKYWEYGDSFKNTDATWKLENFTYVDMCGDGGSYLNQYIDPTDKKVHVVAVFKALSAYSEDDISFDGFEGSDTYNEADDDAVTIKAVVGCALDDDLALVCGPLASPLAYKLNGKLPDGLKFDAKKGVLSGAPKKAGNASVTITATDPAKNAKNLTVNFIVNSLPDWLVGEFRALSCEYSVDSGWVYDEVAGQDKWVESENIGVYNGLLELSVTAAGKVSAKYLHRAGTASWSGNLAWLPDEYDPSAEGYFSFYKEDAKGMVEVSLDAGAVEGFAYAAFKNGRDAEFVFGRLEGLRHDAELLRSSRFNDKYYTFAFHADGDASRWLGYGYLTVKTDKKGGAKVTGQMPDGEKVSMSALLLPQSEYCCGLADEGDISARLCLFSAPSSYKKSDWFAMSLTMAPDGTVSCDGNSVWTLATVADPDDEELSVPAALDGLGAEYSAASSLEGYYWDIVCAADSRVRYYRLEKDIDTFRRSYKAEFFGKGSGGCNYCGIEDDDDRDPHFFHVSLKGDAKGGIVLESKSPAPWIETERWKEDGKTYTSHYWNFDKDKKGNEITDPSQLSFSFTKATGIFSGKATLYFEYDVDFDVTATTSAPLPFNGVVVRDPNEQEPSFEGFGSAVYSYKYYENDESTGKWKSVDRKLSMPVSLERLEQ